LILLDTYAKECELSQGNGYTGMAVSIAIIIMGLHMIINILKVIDEDSTSYIIK